MSTLYIMLGDFNELVDYFSFAAWVFYFITVLGLIRLRWTMADVKREFKVPIVIPILFCICALYLIVAPLIAEFDPKYIMAVLFILFGFVYYLPFVQCGVKVKFMYPLFTYIQYALNIATSYYHEEEENEQDQTADKVNPFHVTSLGLTCSQLRILHPDNSDLRLNCMYPSPYFETTKEIQWIPDIRNPLIKNTRL